MKRRGRPRHPDVLTPREWDVLTLVRDGLTNQQIAERLGISFDAAKYHVAEILSKLHLATREEAAAWQPVPPERPVMRPAWASALGPIASIWRAWPIAARIAGATVMAATVAGLGILLYGVLKSNDNSGDEVQATATVSTSAAPNGSATLTPTPLPVTGALPLTMTDGIGVPENLALIIETGCTECDGPSTSLLRVYRDADGSYVSDTLFTPETVGLGPVTVQTEKGPQQDIPLIAGFAMEPDASQMVVDVTYQVGQGSNLFQSTDGGVTWSNFGSLDAGEFMLSELIDGQVIAEHGSNPNATVAPLTTPYYPPGVFRLYPSGDSIPTPPGADGTWNPVRMADGTVGWQTSDGRLLTASGEEVLHVTGRFDMGLRSFNPPGATAAIWTPGDSGAITYLQVVDPNGKSSATYQLPTFAHPGVWVDGSLAVVNAAFPEPTPQPSGGAIAPTSYPTVIDLKNGTVQPIARPFGDDGYERGRNTVDAVMVGPWALVTGTGSCLNVRAEASESASVVECAADSVLLENLGPAGDEAWLHVRTLSGHEGFASVAYLHVISEPVSTD